MIAHGLPYKCESCQRHDQDVVRDVTLTRTLILTPLSKINYSNDE